MSEMNGDYYDVIGVEPDAPKDEIKAAYRAEVARLKAESEGGKRAPSEAQMAANREQLAELNRAWAVLSDPVQRSRYDARRGEGGPPDDEEEAGEEAAESRSPVPGGLFKNALGGGRARDAARGASTNARPRPEPTIVLPAGMRLAEPKARNMALLFDVSVLAVLFLLVQTLGGFVINDMYPKETKAIDRYVTQVDNADKAKSKADDAKSKADDAAKKAESDLAAAKKSGDTAAEQRAQDALTTARADSAKAKAESDKQKKLSEDTNKKLTDERKKLQGPFFVLALISVAVALLYTVPSSALTGQTLGKRLRRVRLVRVDGSPAGWSASFAHYGVPIAIAILLQGFLGGLAVILGLGLVLWYLRDPNRMGVHDKLAKTVVVEA